jgi:hypothetical protein
MGAEAVDVPDGEADGEVDGEADSEPVGSGVGVTCSVGIGVGVGRMTIFCVGFAAEQPTTAMAIARMAALRLNELVTIWVSIPPAVHPLRRPDIGSVAPAMPWRPL